MFAKFVVFLAVVAVAAASTADVSSFSYDVADPYTGDFKNQAETRIGDNVAGQYSLLEADGTRRTVEYAAGAQGFNAIVRKDPAFIAAAPVITKTIAAPIAPYYPAYPYAFPKFATTFAYPKFGYPYAYARYY